MDDENLDVPDSRTGGQGGAAGGTFGGGGELLSSKTADCYNMNHPGRGVAIIFNNKNFHSSSGMNKRDGTDVDAQHLWNLFTTMEFKTELKVDCTARDMIDVIVKVAQADHAKEDCLAVAILSHGEAGDKIWGTDQAFLLDELVGPLKKCSSLAGKPKLFFIQACRGQLLDEGHEVCDAVPEEEEEEEMQMGEPLIYRIPTNADFLFAYSTVPGFYAWRNQARGSWFIQALCEVFNENWRRMEILNMMTRVAKKVAYDFESNCSGNWADKKQVPCLTSMLTRDVYFTPKRKG